jgi:ribonuclease P protein component
MLRDSWFSVLIRTAEKSSLQVRVPKRVVKLASHRNLIKRLIRESFRLTEKPVHREVTVSLKTTFLKQDRAVVKASLDEMLRRGLSC